MTDATTGTKVRYLSAGFKDRVKPVPRDGMGHAPGQGASGYGDRIATDYMVQDASDPHAPSRGRWYRVYATCWSNAATHYIVQRGWKLVIRGSDLEEALEGLKPHRVTFTREGTGTVVFPPVTHPDRESAERAARDFNRCNQDQTWNRVSAHVEPAKEGADAPA